MTISTYSIVKNIYNNWSFATNCFDNNIGYKCLDAEIRLNWQCNAKCKMCGIAEYIDNKDTKRKQNLNLQEIKELIDELKVLGCANLTLSGGEPTLAPILTDVVLHASYKDINVALNTNGSLLTKEKIYELIEAGLKIFTFSIDSPLEESHDKIRGLKGCFQNIADSIDTINEYNKENNQNVYVLINCVLMKENIYEIHKFIDFYDKHHFHHINFSPASISTKWDQWTTNNDNLRADIDDVKYFKKEIIPLLKSHNWAIQITDPYGEQDDEIKQNINSIFWDIPDKCYIPFLHTVIQSNGDVIPCCYADDSYILGNIRESDFLQIWNSKKYKDFRRVSTSATTLDMCSSCKQYMKINKKIIERNIT